MTASPSAPAPEVLAQCLSATPGSKDRFGSTGEEVLRFAALTEAAEGAWDRSVITAFQEQQKIHPKVWGKLVAIARSTNLQTLDPAVLPASYTALYALVVMSPEELRSAVIEGVVTAGASSRSILEWTKAFRLRGTGIAKEMSLTLVLKNDLTPEQQEALLTALRQQAEAVGCELLDGRSGVRQADLKADARKATAEAIKQQLIDLLASVVSSAPQEIKSRFRVESADDLIHSQRQVFTGFLQVLEGKKQEVFWQQYGRTYCLKIAYDFNQTDSRAERYLLRKRIQEAIERWGIERQIPGFKSQAEEIQRTYMGK